VLHLARLYAFAEVYDTPQLREDVMTVIVELCRQNSMKVSQRDCLQASQELYDALPSNSPICRYRVTRLAVYSSFKGTTRLNLEPLPRAFLIDTLMVVESLKGDKTKVKDEIQNSYNYHNHNSETEIVDCKKRQKKYGAFYISLMRACLDGVYAAEDGDTAQRTKSPIAIPNANETLKPFKSLECETLIGEGAPGE
jgi:hypothetical protein